MRLEGNGDKVTEFEYSGMECTVTVSGGEVTDYQIFDEQGRDVTDSVSEHDLDRICRRALDRAQ